MKIRHNIKRNWKILSGRILETIFEEWEYRWDREEHFDIEWKFFISSANFPSLECRNLYVFWKVKNRDNICLEYKYNTEERAQQVLDYINEFTIKEIKNWDLVWVSDTNQEDANKDFTEDANHYYIWKDKNWNFVCEHDDWKYIYWRFISNKKSNTKEMTLEQVCRELWRDIKIIK